MNFNVDLKKMVREAGTVVNRVVQVIFMISVLIFTLVDNKNITIVGF